MSENIRGIVSQKSYRLSPEHGAVDLRLTPRGEIIGMPFFSQLALDGRVFVANLGKASTPITYKAAYDADQPEGVIDVPKGTTIIPITIDIAIEEATGAGNEIVIGSAASLAGAGTSTLITPANLNPTQPRDPVSKVYSHHTANCTDVTALASFVEWKRWAQPSIIAAGTMNNFQWSALDSGLLVPLVGPASLVVWIAGAVAPKGFITFIYAEFETPQLII
jgi:hypothetical protein